MSSRIYFRRWTRMHINPAARYFQKYDTVENGLQGFMHLANKQNPIPENRKFSDKMAVDRQLQINNKLIKNLFLKYPDLKYESINRQKYHGDNFNSYSYSYAFITEQKKLMKAGYTMKKAFQITQQKFQQKMKRKIDQSLISRGLAIGNRARSLLTIYQQQVQHESRLKMLRTKRQVLKYQQQLKEIDEAIKKPIQTEEQQAKQNYERIFQKITQESSESINQEYSQQKRGQLVKRMEGEFKDMFSQFYETAGYKDRLRGFTDEQIKQEIRSSPNKIKRLTRQLVKYLKNKGGITISPGGQLKMNENLNQKLKSFIYSSPTVKIAILNHLIGYESPHFSYKKKMESQAKAKLNELRRFRGQKLDQDQKSAIKQNKIKQLQSVVEKNIPDDNRAYRLLQSAEERMLRLEIKYLESFIQNQQNVDETVFDRLKKVIEQFRRVKFRMQKRHKASVEDQLMFPEHHVFDKHPNQLEDKNIEYEDLLDYLRRKSQERRLKAIDQADDNKINDMIKKQACNETPKSEGQQNNN